ncbi:ABC transporter ATP-binding protein [Jannaschia rubra]|uniref:Polysialic acid transport ATP-binding protein KpsT n=1 Tax=Jannaschia rubra TaxID=282197 RepID=A0A0M6XPT9_9RHOB|nr:ABC transporter ATP-binding protein [Jannaschia rubra]CTQ33196.1 Polysialic acid transport ATP-binding protein KpsT [Jannaschia rubra]SFF96728.1 capsular polysaccharide transport system ATP-binding protein [Jannaschia rubra]
MIEFHGVCKTFHLSGSRKVIADNISAVFPPRRSVALLGRNGAGKSSLLRMISGAIRPDQGTIRTTGSVSWTVGFQGSFHPDMSGAQNVRFVARVYGVDTDELLDFVADFAELGGHFDQPVRTYSSGMRSRLAFAVSMGIHFDTYLVDEVTSVGDAAFKVKSEAVMNDRLRRSGAVVVSHSMGLIRRICNAAAVLERGHMTYYDSIDEGIAAHERNMNAVAPDDD